MKKAYLILTIALAGIVLVSYCNVWVPPEEKSVEELPEEEEVPPAAVKFMFTGKKIEIAKGAVFSGILFVDDNFYVTYGAPPRDGERNQMFVKGFDENFGFTGFSKQLTDVEIGIADHQTIHIDGYFYSVYSTPGNRDLYLEKFDSNWNSVGMTTVVTASPMNQPTNDMFLNHADGFLYVGTVDISPEHEFYQYIRKYDLDLEFKGEFVLTDVSSNVGSSMIFFNNTFIIVSSDKFWDDANIIVLRYDSNWNFIDSKTISADPSANERFPMGLLFKDGRFYVSYTHQTGILFHPGGGGEPPSDYGDIILKAFDSDWNVLGQVKVTDELPANSANRAHLAWANNKIYVSYDTSDLEIIVKEYAIEVMEEVLEEA
jgi:hypothetical protein